MINKEGVILALEATLKDEGRNGQRICELIERYPKYLTCKELSNPKIQNLALAMLYQSLHYVYDYKDVVEIARFVKKFNFPKETFKTEDFFKKVENVFLEYIKHVWGQDGRFVGLIMNTFDLPKEILLRDSIQAAISKQISDSGDATIGSTLGGLSEFFGKPFSVKDRRHLMLALDKVVGQTGCGDYLPNMKSVSKAVDLSVLYLGCLDGNEEEFTWAKKIRNLIVSTLICGGYDHYDFLCKIFKCNVESEIRKILLGDQGIRMLEAILEWPKVNLSVDLKKDPEIKQVASRYWAQLTKESDPRAKKLEEVFFPN